MTLAVEYFTRLSQAFGCDIRRQCTKHGRTKPTGNSSTVYASNDMINVVPSGNSDEPKMDVM